MYPPGACVQRSARLLDRYLWLRVGYQLPRDLEGRGASTEHRGVFEITARAPLPWQIWLTGRSRADLRDIDGEVSARGRLRGGLERELLVGGLTLVPYVQTEVFYDTRFGAWNRELLPGRGRDRVHQAPSRGAVPRRAGGQALVTGAPRPRRPRAEAVPVSARRIRRRPPPTTVHDHRRLARHGPHARAFSSLGIVARWRASCRCQVSPDLTIGCEETHP